MLDSPGRRDDALYLCNFRVSVDGEWFCLREAEGEPETETDQSLYCPDYPIIGLIHCIQESELFQ